MAPTAAPAGIVMTSKLQVTRCPGSPTQPRSYNAPAAHPAAAPTSAPVITCRVRLACTLLGRIMSDDRATWLDKPSEVPLPRPGEMPARAA